MTVHVIIVTHGVSGSELLREAEFIIGHPMEGITAVSFGQSGDSGDSLTAVRAAIEKAGVAGGVLLLTDLLGASPCNMLSGLLEEYGAVMVTGINLPMLLRVWNYRNEPLGALARKAAEGGRQGVKILQK